MRVVFLCLIAVVFVGGSIALNRSVSAQATKTRQRNAIVVLMPTGNSKATGMAYLSISDGNNSKGTSFMVARIEVNGMPTGLFATHIHEGFCPPPVGPEPDQQGPIRVDFADTVGFNLDSVTRSLVSVTVLQPSDMPTRSGGITNVTDLLDSSRNFYLNIHQRSKTDPAGIGPGLTCGRVVFQ